MNIWEYMGKKCDSIADKLRSKTDRRGFLQALLVSAGAVGGASIFYGPKKAHSAEAATLPWTNPLPPDWELESYMKQPVATTLSGSDVKNISGANVEQKWMQYNQHVFQNDIPRNKRVPTMVFFYIKNSEASRGLAAVVKSVKDIYKHRIKLCAYELPSNISQEAFNAVAERYNLKGAPTMLLYKTDKDSMYIEARITGGFKEIERVKLKISQVSKYINTKILKQ